MNIVSVSRVKNNLYHYLNIVMKNLCFIYGRTKFVLRNARIQKPSNHRLFRKKNTGYVDNILHCMGN